jgi:hypothetical protein
MNKQSQWLFETPPISEGDRHINPYTNPEYYGNPEWEADWELWETPDNSPCICSSNCPQCKRKQPPWAAKPDYIIHHFKFEDIDFCDKRSPSRIEIIAHHIISTWPNSSNPKPRPDSIIRVDVIGHTDYIGGNSEANYNLALQRALFVRSLLINEIKDNRPNLIPKIFINADSRSTREPFYSNNALDRTPAGRSCNRRVEIFFLRLRGNPSVPPQVSLRSGSQGSLVRHLQISLNQWLSKMPQLGLALLNVDGIYGARTVSAVRAFQGSKGLVADGIVGPQTWRHISSISSREGEFEVPPQKKSSQKKCRYPNVANFVRSYWKDAQQIASSLKIPPENILGLAGQESSWGKSNIAKNANNFFGLWGEGTQGTYLTKGKRKVAKFSNFLESGQAFAARFGSLVQGKVNPENFARSLVPKFNKARAPRGNPDFVPTVKNAINLVKSHRDCQP